MDIAYHFHIGPRELDELTVRRAWQLVDAVKEIRKENAKQK